MQTVGWMILLLLIVARPALAAFEGYIEMKMTMKEGAGTMKGQIYVLDQDEYAEKFEGKKKSMNPPTTAPSKMAAAQ